MQPNPIYHIKETTGHVPVFLAPMAGYTDIAFRVLCKSFGCDLTVTEMVSAKGLIYGSDKTAELLRTAEEERPVIMQLFGREPEALSQAAMRICDEQGDALFALDLNLGCPATKIAGNGEGSALLEEPVLVGRIVEALAKSASVPVSVKIRKGSGAHNDVAPEIARIAQDNGAAWVAVHGRTREQGYSGQADWDCIRRVKEAVTIPVIGNGDVRSGQDALALIKATGCDGIMIGRGALGAPWIFDEVRTMLLHQEWTEPGYEEKMRIAIRHTQMTVAEKGPHGIVELRKHLPYYISGGRRTAQTRVRLNMARSVEEIEEILLDTVKMH